MAILPILTVPDPRLRKRAYSVEKVDTLVIELMENMLETMYAAPGIGLAAPQVGISQQILVIDIPGDGVIPMPILMVNPKILWTSTECSTCQEGCLSLPEQYAAVTRPTRIHIQYVNHTNVFCDLEADSLLSVVVQHEIDHLKGALFIDHISRLKKDIILRRMRKVRHLQV